MSAAANVVDFHIRGVGAGATTAAIRAALEGSRRLSNSAGALGRRRLRHRRCRWRRGLRVSGHEHVARPAHPRPHGKPHAGNAILGHHAAAPLQVFPCARGRRAGLTPGRYASKEAAAYAIYLVRNKLSPPTDVIVLSAPSTTEQIK